MEETAYIDAAEAKMLCYFALTIQSDVERFSLAIRYLSRLVSTAKLRHVGKDVGSILCRPLSQIPEQRDLLAKDCQIVADYCFEPGQTVPESV